MHETSQDKVCQLIRELDCNVDQVLEIMFRYRMDEKEVEAEEEKEITKDYKVGLLDPCATTTKYEREIAFKKRKLAVMLWKR